MRPSQVRSGAMEDSITPGLQVIGQFHLNVNWWGKSGTTSHMW